MTKVVQLADDAYEALARHKRPGDSFSDVVRRAFPRRALMDLVGARTAAECDAHIKLLAELNALDAKRSKKLERWWSGDFS